MTRASVALQGWVFWLAVAATLLMALLNLVGAVSLSWWVVFLPVLVVVGFVVMGFLAILAAIAYTLVVAWISDALPPRY